MKRCADCGRRSSNLIRSGYGSLEISLCPPSRIEKCQARRARKLAVRSKERPRSSKVLSKRFHQSRGK